MELRQKELWLKPLVEINLDLWAEDFVEDTTKHLLADPDKGCIRTSEYYTSLESVGNDIAELLLINHKGD